VLKWELDCEECPGSSKVANHVIVRISSTSVSESELGSYLAYLESGVIPRYEAAAGMIMMYLLKRRFVAYVEVLSVSLWQSQEALRRFVTTQSPMEDDKREYDVIELEPRNFEVVLSLVGKVLADEESQQT
jgi:heme-degrading monooxygenase HmoA